MRFPSSTDPFGFLDPGPLVDEELELGPPQLPWLNDLMAVCRHPLTVRDMPREAETSREQLVRFIRQFPNGHQPADPVRSLVPTYHFWMHLNPGADTPAARDLARQSIHILGGCSLRIGTTDEIELYYGHVGYHVYPAARGHHFAERACRLLLPLARRHGINPLWITTNPDTTPPAERANAWAPPSSKSSTSPPHAPYTTAANARSVVTASICEPPMAADIRASA
jgi:predicted acetyltransferase